jgi:hypothetical protein
MKPKASNPQQSARFIAAAKKAGVRGSNDAFEQVIGKIVGKKSTTGRKPNQP